MPEDNPWAVLGLVPASGEEQVRQAYLRLARENHPDLFREDPRRYRAQEERMKAINGAYAQITSGEAAQHGLPPSPPTAPSCRQHSNKADRVCQACAEPLCPRCSGYQNSYCPRHASPLVLPNRPRRFIREWGGLAALLALGQGMHWPLIPFLCVTLGYLAILGVMQLRRVRYFGFMVWLFLPYSVVLAGLYSLFTALKPPTRPLSYHRAPRP